MDNLFELDPATKRLDFEYLRNQYDAGNQFIDAFPPLSTVPFRLTSLTVGTPAAPSPEHVISTYTRW